MKDQDCELLVNGDKSWHFLGLIIHSDSESVHPKPVHIPAVPSQIAVER
jgi:hypothetical protein